MPEKCHCCREEAVYSILVAGDGGRLYLPNQDFRRLVKEGKHEFRELWFCKACMRKIEDSLRATVLYLQAESL